MNKVTAKITGQNLFENPKDNTTSLVQIRVTASIIILVLMIFLFLVIQIVPASRENINEKRVATFMLLPSVSETYVSDRFCGENIFAHPNSTIGYHQIYHKNPVVTPSMLPQENYTLDPLVFSAIHDSAPSVATYAKNPPLSWFTTLPPHPFVLAQPSRNPVYLWKGNAVSWFILFPEDLQKTIATISAPTRLLVYPASDEFLQPRVCIETSCGDVNFDRVAVKHFSHPEILRKLEPTRVMPLVIYWNPDVKGSQK